MKSIEERCDCCGYSYSGDDGDLLHSQHSDNHCAGKTRRNDVMITFIAGMAAGAGALVGLFKVMCIRWERVENRSRRTRKKPAFSQKKQVGFCGDICRNNTWMQETASHE